MINTLMMHHATTGFSLPNVLNISKEIYCSSNLLS